LEAKLTYERRNHLPEQFQARKIINVPRRHSTQEVTEGQARVLASKFGHLKQPSVALSEHSGTSERAARNHLAGANAMNLTDFFNACQRIPELKLWGAHMMGLVTSMNPLVETELHRLIRAYYAILEQKQGAAE
jgi:hypothetical protein